MINGYNDSSMGVVIVCLATFLITVVSVAALGGPPEILWEKKFGGDDINRAEYAELLPDGSIVIAGYTNSYGAGDYDVYLLKIGPTGSKLWEYTYGGEKSDGGYYISVTPDGGYIIAGWTYSFGASKGAKNNFYLVRTDSSGKRVWLWENAIGGDEHEYATCVKPTPDGGFIVCGNKDVVMNNLYNTQVYLVKVNANGTTLWTRSYGGHDQDWVRSLVVCRDGGYIMAGKTMSYGLTDDVYVLKTDKDGNLLWEKTYGGPGLDWANEIIQVSDGGYMIIGGTEGLDYEADVYVVKISDSGRLQWEKRIRASDGADWGISIRETRDGGYIIAGTTVGACCKFDIYIAKLNSNGAVVWEKTIGASGDEWPETIIVTGDEEYIVVGNQVTFAFPVRIFVVALGTRR